MGYEAVSNQNLTSLMSEKSIKYPFVAVFMVQKYRMGDFWVTMDDFGGLFQWHAIDYGVLLVTCMEPQHVYYSEQFHK